MIKYSRTSVLFFFVLSLCCSFKSLHAQTATEIAQAVFAKTNAIRSMRYTMKKLERINGKMINQVSSCKLILNPLHVYLRQQAPKDGIEVLYVQGTNNNQALINPNGFPWFSISLDPFGSTMRENQHHTLMNSGYAHVMSILEHLYKKYNKEIETLMTLEGSIVWDAHNCWIIHLNNPHFGYYKYTATKGENLLTIAGRLKLSEHMILEKNPSIKNYNENLAGKTILLPVDYSSKMVLYIDKQRFIPLFMKVSDDQGLYEQYEYSDVLLNTVIKPEEFKSDYPEYNF